MATNEPIGRSGGVQTTKLVVATIFGGVALLGAGCARAPSTPASTTVTSAVASVGPPRSVLAVGVREAGDVPPSVAGGAPEARCGDLPQGLLFDEGESRLTRGELAVVDRWATCLRSERMQPMALVLTGGLDPSDDPGRFERRARVVQAALAARGIPSWRVVVGTPNACREGGRRGESSSVWLELSSSATLGTLR